MDIHAIFPTLHVIYHLSSSVTILPCNGGSDGSIDLTVTGGSGSYSYSWDNGSTSEDLSGLSAGTYIVTVTDSWGCTESLTVVVTEPSVITSSSTVTSCDDYIGMEQAYTTSWIIYLCNNQC